MFSDVFRFRFREAVIPQHVVPALRKLCYRQYPASDKTPFLEIRDVCSGKGIARRFPGGRYKKYRFSHFCLFFIIAINRIPGNAPVSPQTGSENRLFDHAPAETFFFVVKNSELPLRHGITLNAVPVKTAVGQV